MVLALIAVHRPFTEHEWLPNLAHLRVNPIQIYLPLTISRQIGHMTPSSPTQRNSKRQAAEMRGRAAEAAVAAIWQAQGFNVLAQRLRTRSGEIDLIVADPETLVFVEVKARKTFEDAAYALLPRQQMRLLQAADSALGLHAEWNRPNIRFDVALVCDGKVENIEDAIRQN
jgi:putative endonuclease